MLFVLVV